MEAEAAKATAAVAVAAWMDGPASLARPSPSAARPRGFAHPETVERERERERAMPDVSDLVAAAALLQQVNECCSDG